MIRTLLGGAVLAAAALASTPSASAEPICVQATITKPTTFNTGRHCQYGYPFGAPCLTQGASLGTLVNASVYACVPSLLVVPTS